MSFQRQDFLFHRPLYEQEVALFKAPGEVMKLRTALAALTGHSKRGTLAKAGHIQITERKAEQAFNRLLFEDGLGFRGMFDLGKHYSLLPQVSFPAHGGGRKYISDVAIGHFSSVAGTVDAVLELKDPSSPLDKPQSGAGYKHPVTGEGMSPIEQAVETMKAAKARWALVSNMDELCLIHSSDPTRGLWADLRKLTQNDYASIVFAFGYGGFISKGKPRLEALYERVKLLLASRTSPKEHS